MWNSANIDPDGRNADINSVGPCSREATSAVRGRNSMQDPCDEDSVKTHESRNPMKDPSEMLAEEEASRVKKKTKKKKKKKDPIRREITQGKTKGQ